MLKNLIQLIEETGAVSNEMQRNIRITTKAIEAAVKSWMTRKETIQVAVHSPNRAVFTLELRQWLRPETIDDVCKEMHDAIKNAKIPGEVFKIEDNSIGSEFVEALLSGLSPGMKPIKPEAFFPTFQFNVTWKNIVSRKG